MNTDEVFKMLLLETSPERAGRVGYLRKLNAEKAKKSAEFWDNDDAWGAAKKAQQKYDSHTATVDRHMKKFSRDRDSDWAKKLAAGYKGEETDVKNMRRNIKIGAGVGLGLAGAYGAYRLLRGKKKPIEKEKAVASTKSAEPKKNVINTRQDPTEPASYPFKDSEATRVGNLMEMITPKPLTVARGRSGPYFRDDRRRLLRANQEYTQALKGRLPQEIVYHREMTRIARNRLANTVSGVGVTRIDGPLVNLGQRPTPTKIKHTPSSAFRIYDFRGRHKPQLSVTGAGALKSGISTNSRLAGGATYKKTTPKLARKLVAARIGGGRLKMSTDVVWANLMEGAIANYLKQAREFSKQHKKPFKDSATIRSGNLMEMISPKPLTRVQGSLAGSWLWSRIRSDRRNAITHHLNYERAVRDRLPTWDRTYARTLRNTHRKFLASNFSESTNDAWANLMEGIWGRIKGAAAGLRDKFRDIRDNLRDKVLDKYVAPAYHASVKFPGAEPHDSVTQGRITRMYRALGGKSMSPTLVRHKDNTGMAYMKVPAIGAPDGKLPVIAAPARGTRVVGQLRRGKGVVAGFNNSSGFTHEVGHAVLTSKGDISHKRMPMVDALNKRHPKNVFGGIAKLDPKTYATQTRLHMRSEGRNNTFLGTNKNRLRAAKTSMTAAARSLYDDVKKHAPDEAPRFVQRYKNFRRAWRKGSPTAHLKLSTDAAWGNLMEGVIPWLFSKPDLVKNQGAKVHFITGLAGSGKTRHIMGLPDTHRRLSADHYFPENKDVDMHDTPFPRVVRGIVKKGEPATIEGVQAAFLHHKYPDQRWTVKRTSFLRSLANQTHRDWRNGGVTKAIKNLVKVPRRVEDNLVFKRQIDREFKEAEYLPGGRAEGKPSRAFPPKQLRMGRKVEMEHTRNPRVAEEIAKDHLTEFKDYYTRLAQMEREARRSHR